MSPAHQNRRINFLAIKSDVEVTREKNLARNRAWGAQINAVLGNGSTWVGTAEPQKKRRSRTSSGTSGTKRKRLSSPRRTAAKRARTNNGSTSSNSDSDERSSTSDSNDDSSDDDAPADKQEPRVTRSNARVTRSNAESGSNEAAPDTSVVNVDVTMEPAADDVQQDVPKGKGKAVDKAQRGKEKRLAASKDVLDKEENPAKWADDARLQLVAPELGEQWGEVLKKWYEREEDRGFVVKPRPGVTTDHCTFKASVKKPQKAAPRPECIGEWARWYRSAAFKHNIREAAVFGAALAAWWYDVNPSWRRREGGVLAKEPGDYSVLDVPGPNGFLAVLIGLRWWAAETKGKPSAEWERMVGDIEWCLQQL
uniref:Uncharacterized protein n=1 Tax=Mycena chlorophos TaxID=658473 RepID=A0ABQ0L0X5_MYCCL|nr:predicted protein [Mycena chlorophos]